MCHNDVCNYLKTHTPTGSDTLDMSCQVTIVSYDMLPKFQLIGKFNCAIADESHFIKNREFGLQPGNSSAVTNYED